MPRDTFDRDLGLAYLARLRELGVETRSIVAMRGGEVVFEHATHPFPLDYVHPLYSVTKSFTSVAVGMLVDEGRVDVGRPWISWFPEYEAAVADERFLGVTVRDLLTMTLGQDGEPYVRSDDDWALGVVGKELSHEPGTVFCYNSMCSHLLSMLVQRVSGQRLADFLSKRLFEPLGIRRWWWEEDRRGHSTGGFGLHLSTPDLARFGQCLLDGGTWEGRRVIPAAWVAEATRPQVRTRPFLPADATEDRNGYGYQFWMCAGGGFRCSGLFGQLCYVRPEDALVVAASSSTTGSKVLLDPLYEVLGGGYPVCGVSGSSLDVLPVVDGAAHARASEERLEGRHRCLDNPGGFDAFELYVDDESATGPQAHLAFERGGDCFRIDAGSGDWLRAPAKQRPVGELFPFATHGAERDAPPSWDVPATFASYGWTSSTTLVISVRELDATRRTFVRMSVDGRYALCELWAEGMLGGMEPMHYTMVAEV